MRIGILTVPFNNNYGGFLQAYALKTILLRMGHEVIFINRRRNKKTSLKFRFYYLMIKLHIIDDFLEKRIREISVYTEEFKKRYLSPITEEYYSTVELRECTKLGIDFYVVGSDQVWRYNYAQDSIDNYFFNFLEGIDAPRISFSASFGTDNMEYPKEKVDKVSALLKKFVGISVREQSGKELLEKYFGLQPDFAKVVLDPTLLLLPEDYEKLFKDKKVVNGEKYLFTYILDYSNQIEEVLYTIKSELGIKKKEFKVQTSDLKAVDVIAPVEDWLASIYYADYVITDSFHGTVFSILFNKPFITICNPERGIARQRELLSKFEVNDRLVYNLEKNDIQLLKKTINWANVNRIIHRERESSINFLEVKIKQDKRN